MVKAQRIVIATHYLMYGAAHALRDYLNLKKANELVLIGLPFHEQRNLLIEEYHKGEEVCTTSSTRKKSPEIINYLKDFLAVILIILKKKEKYDVFIGVNNLNCFAGLVLKKLNIVNKVIYYSIDFVPIRFSNKLINNVYHSIEIFAVKNSDEVWNVSPRIAEGREEFLNLKKTSKQKVVPIGIWKDRRINLESGEINKHQAVFIGHILEKQGVQEVIDAIPYILKDIPKFRFIIIGEGEYLKTLKEKVKEKNLQDSVIFQGKISNRDEINKYLSESAVAYATYKPEKERLYNFTYYADPTKIKDYLSAGLPIIMTDVPYNADYLMKKQCAVVVEYNAKEIAKATKSLLLNDDQLTQFRRNAHALSQHFNWVKIFNKISI